LSVLGDRSIWGGDEWIFGRKMILNSTKWRLIRIITTMISTVMNDWLVRINKMDWAILESISYYNYISLRSKLEGW
jgi:hypothetical protein